ncbi:MAG: TetR family transcriptional regulator [Desulfobacteraceae bacterium]|nr:TetR family transcriptional regulator [Desulfobacteraceae bacterium]
MGRKSNANERRKQILQALYECLSEKGHERVTIKKIAQRAGLPHGVIHYYFTDKDEIIAELVQTLQETYYNQWDKLLSTISGDSKKIPAAIDFLAESMVLDPGLNRVLYNLVQMGFERKPVRDAMKQAYQIYRQQLADLFFKDLLAAEQHASATALLAMVEGLALQWMIEEDIIKPAQIKALLRKVLI